MVSEWKTARQLVQTLSYFPLAITQAGAHILMHRQDSPIASYLELYLRYPRYLLAHQSVQDDWDSSAKKDSVLTTWEISYDAVRNKGPEAARLLLICGFLDRTNIDLDLFIRKSPGGDGSSTSGRKPKELEVREAFELLLAYSFLKESGVPGKYSMHPLVHIWARMRLSLDDQRKVYRESLLMLFEHLQQPTGPRKDLRPHVRQLYRFSQDTDPCLFIGGQRIPQAPLIQSDPSPSFALAGLGRFLSRIVGWSWRLRGEITSVIRYVCRRYCGPACMGNWELLYEMQHIPEGQDTVDLVAWVLCQARRSLPLKHPRVLEIVGNHGNALMEAKMTDGPAGSLAWYRWLLEARSQVLGPSHPATSGAMLGMGLSLIKQNRTSCDDGLDYILRAFNIRKTVLGLDDTLTKNALSALAVAEQQCLRSRSQASIKAAQELLVYALTEGGEKLWRILHRRSVHSVMVILIRNMLQQGRGACSALHLFRHYDVHWTRILSVSFGNLSDAAPVDFPDAWGSVDSFPGSPRDLFQIHVSGFSFEDLCELARAAWLQCIYESIARSPLGAFSHGLTGWPIIHWSKPCPMLKEVVLEAVTDAQAAQAYRDQHGEPLAISVDGEEVPAAPSFLMDVFQGESRSLQADRAIRTIQEVLDTLHALVPDVWKPEDVDTLYLAEMPMFYERVLFDPAVGAESVLMGLDLRLEEQISVGREVLDFWFKGHCPGHKGFANYLTAVVGSWDEESRGSRSCFSGQDPRLWTMCPAA